MNRLYKHEDVVQMLVDVIEQIEEKAGFEIVDRPMGWESVRDYAEEVVSDMPSAENKGEWIYCEDDEGQDGYRCSECGFFVPWYYGHEDINYIYKYHACPSCMAMMKGADDED